jgi:hypothetical protein
LPCQISIGGKSKPLEVFEQRCLELWTASSAIVVLDAQQHTRVGPARARDIPDIDGVENVPEVEITGGSGGKSGD